MALPTQRVHTNPEVEVVGGPPASARGNLSAVPNPPPASPPPIPRLPLIPAPRAIAQGCAHPPMCFGQTGSRGGLAPTNFSIATRSANLLSSNGTAPMRHLLTALAALTLHNIVAALADVSPQNPTETFPPLNQQEKRKDGNQ